MLSQKFYGSEMRHGIFGGLNFGAGIFLGFEFCPHSIIPVTWNQEYPPPPGGLEGLENVIAELHSHMKRARGQSPIAKECGNLSIPENLVITWPYTERSSDRAIERASEQATVHPHHRHTNVK